MHKKRLSFARLMAMFEESNVIELSLVTLVEKELGAH